MPNREPTKEEFEALSKDLTEVLVKHNAEMGVKSSIELMIRMPDLEKLKKEDEAKEGAILSTFMDQKDGDEPATTEEGPKA